MDQLLYNPTLEDWRTHDGVDIAAAEGSSVLAASAGTVVAVDDDVLMGTTVVIEHSGGYHTLYANLQSPPLVKAGDAVSAGQLIGTVGTSAAAESAQGPHLHFSVTLDGEPVDPASFLKK
jgi:murein DD-endopeptidase MepM/ murein hydrolase activator NlpD